MHQPIKELASKPSDCSYVPSVMQRAHTHAWDVWQAGDWTHGICLYTDNTCRIHPFQTLGAISRSALTSGKLSWSCSMSCFVCLTITCAVRRLARSRQVAVPFKDLPVEE